MWVSTNATQGSRIDLVVIGHAVVTATAVALIIAGLVVAREKLIPHFEAGTEDIVLPSNIT